MEEFFHKNLNTSEAPVDVFGYKDVTLLGKFISDLFTDAPLGEQGCLRHAECCTTLANCRRAHTTGSARTPADGGDAF